MMILQTRYFLLFSFILITIASCGDNEELTTQTNTPATTQTTIQAPDFNACPRRRRRSAARWR